MSPFAALKSIFMRGGFLLILLFCLYEGNTQSDRMALADSLKNEQKYQQAFLLYDSISDSLCYFGEKEEWYSCQKKLIVCVQKGGFSSPDSILANGFTKAQWEEDFTAGLLYLQLGKYYQDSTSDPASAIAAYKNALSLLQTDGFENWWYYAKYETFFQTKNRFWAMYIYQPLGTLYSNLGEVQKSSFYNELAEQIFIKEKDSFQLAQTYLNWSGTLWDGRNYSEALSKIEKGLSALNEPRSKIGAALLSNKALYLSIIAETQSDQKKTDSILSVAQIIVENAISILNEPEIDADRYLWKAHHTYGDILLKRGDTTSALDALELGFSIAASEGDTTNRQIAKLELSIASLKLSQRVHREALTYCQRALSRILPNFPTSQLHKVPEADQLYLENVFLEALSLKTQIYLSYYKKGKEKKFLTFALPCIRQSLLVEDLFIETYQYENSQLQFVEESHRRHELALELLYILIKEFGEENMKDEFFRVMEKSRAVIFQLEFDKYRLWDASGNQKNQYYELNREIGEVRREIVFESNASRRLVLKKRLNALLQKKDTLNQALSEQFPELSQKFQKDTISIAKTQEYLGKRDSTLLIQYLWGNKYLYAISIDPQDFRPTQIPISDSLKNWRDRYKTSLSSPENALRPAYFKSFLADAQYGFDKLLRPIIPYNFKGHVVIIPDGDLGLISFDCLLTKPYPDSSKVEYMNLPYWFKDVDIRYSHSANLLVNRPNKASSPDYKNYLGIAPKYDFRLSGLLDLDYGVGLTKRLSRLLKGKKLAHKNATIHGFKECIKKDNFHIVHFHGHGSASDEPWLAFTATPPKDSGLLFLHILYGLPIHSDLTILSACHSGIGRVAVGEGILNLGRAVQLSGSKNVLLRLWETDEKETARIIEKFVQTLAEGKGKAKALQETKAWYMTEYAPAKHHPYYWANFYIIGDNQPIIFSKSQNNQTLFLKIFLVFIIGGIGFLIARVLSRKMEG